MQKNNQVRRKKGEMQRFKRKKKTTVQPKTKNAEIHLFFLRSFFFKYFER